MATQSLQDEASCSICLDYFKEPVTLDCGHNFCQTCITQCWGGLETNVSCPECRAIFPQRKLRPNRQLANVVEIAKQLHLQSTQLTEAISACEKHEEALKLFCREDQSPICVVCDRSKEHRSHTVVPIEEASQDYKVGRSFQNQLLLLHCTACRVCAAEGQAQSGQQTENERKKILSEFHMLHEFLEEKELLLLAQLEVLDKEILKRQDEFTIRLTQEISRLSNLISEIEGKFQQPASEFLQVQLCERVLQNTAHPQLVLSENRKCVRWGQARQDVPSNPRRFDPVPCVLGCEGFTSGRHFWEMEVEGSGWAVGVARESVRRKGGVSLEPEEGIWAVGQLNPIQYVGGRFWTVGVARESIRRKGHMIFRPNTGVLGLQKYNHLCVALTSPSNTYVPLKENSNELGVYLDYELGQVSFYNLSNMELVFTFPPVSFNGERVFPYFCVLLSHIKLSPQG
uniref:Zinc finger protein RFP-like n=1 Tax=Pelusios castaneus TaxID=367368 RepID=A0A8C8RE14_9SAUR